MSRVLASLLVSAALAGWAPLTALADGDPASDYLLSQSTFLSPFDGAVGSAQAARLVAMLAQAANRGFSLKVAVIVTPYDLGSVPILFGKPQTYARFLGEEDFYYWKNELLVVMPNGYGIYKSKGLPQADRALVARLRAPGTHVGTALVLDAQRVLSALAQRRGISLDATAGGSSSSTRERVEIGGSIAGALLVGFVLRRVFRRRRDAEPA